MSNPRAVYYRIARLAFMACCLLLALPAANVFAATGRVEGRVKLLEKPVAGVYVYAYKEPGKLFIKNPSAPPAITDSDGRFSFELPKGDYFFAGAKKAGGGMGAPGPGDYYCYYGGNPVTVDPARPAEIVLSLVEKPAPREDTDGSDGHGGVEGVVTLNGEPLDGVIIYVFLDTLSALRGMGYYNSAPTGVDGAYRLKMEQGTYYIVARKRLNGSLAGPLQEGDYFGYPDMNPLVVYKGKVKHIDIPVVRKVDNVSAGGHGRTVVTGVITDSQGRPAGGVQACLYKEAEMLNRPAFVSMPTGPDGRFTVEVPMGGMYYLGARDTIGGPVESGQLWGRYNGSPDHSVNVETGKAVEGLVVVVEKVE